MDRTVAVLLLLHGTLLAIAVDHSLDGLSNSVDQNDLDSTGVRLDCAKSKLNATSAGALPSTSEPGAAASLKTLYRTRRQQSRTPGKRPKPRPGVFSTMSMTQDPAEKAPPEVTQRRRRQLLPRTHHEALPNSPRTKRSLQNKKKKGKGRPGTYSMLGSRPEPKAPRTKRSPQNKNNKNRPECSSMLDHPIPTPLRTKRSLQNKKKKGKGRPGTYSMLGSSPKPMPVERTKRSLPLKKKAAKTIVS
ncbi:uncharacterized protein LOC136771822 isoform X2 [Amia ocellicauda]|uniref:uncharacterized protein LOC136771822 isoform X2 n=1 Tax=Amia ocellicauda TaxID=2972642 RepID=UPI003464B9C2